jgi:hypothetical protein
MNSQNLLFYQAPKHENEIAESLIGPGPLGKKTSILTSVKFHGKLSPVLVQNK